MSEIEKHDSTEQSVSKAKSAPEDRSLKGPFDIKELTSVRPYIDLGSIRVEPQEGLQVRLDVDQGAKRVVAVSLDYDQSTIQVQAFAAPKSTGLWNKAIGELTKQLEAQGAKVVANEGTFETELFATLTKQTPEGQTVTNVRFVGVDGPRWMLRGAISGRALHDEAAAEAIETIFRGIVVVRGEQPMPPNELLPLKVPAGAQPKSD